MIRPHPQTSETNIVVSILPQHRWQAELPALIEYVHGTARAKSLGCHPAWLGILNEAFSHETYALIAKVGPYICGYLPLAFVESMLFGRHLVSLPYLNSNGVLAVSIPVQRLLIDRAVQLGEELDVRQLQFRHEQPIEHPLLNASITHKVHMRKPLSETVSAVWKGYDPKVRNQVRKGEKNSFTVTWGQHDWLDAFYKVLSENMRDLGTPIYTKKLFASILETFRDRAEICMVWDGANPIAGALLLHGYGVTEVPTASSLRSYNKSCANMLMYRHLVDRAIERDQSVFDFGRSTIDGPTYKFKKQWGATPQPAHWQLQIREGDVSETRSENPKYERMIRAWQKLPVWLTQWIGPPIVRGIP